MAKIIYEISGGTPNYIIDLKDIYTTNIVDSMVVTMDGTYFFDNVVDGIYYLESVDSINCTILSGQIDVSSTPITTTTTTTTLPPTTTTTTTPSPISDVVFAMVDGTNVYVTDDSGDNFSDQSPAGSPNLSDLDFGFTETGYTVGVGYFGRGVYNGGGNTITWSDKSSNIPGTFSTTNIEAVGRYPLINDDVVLFQSTQGDIGVTVNGGNSMIEGGYYGVAAPNTSNSNGITASYYAGGGTGGVGGFAMGGRGAINSPNGGDYWYKSSSDLTGWYNSLNSTNPQYSTNSFVPKIFRFQDEANGFVIRKNPGSGGQVFTIRKTSNTGATWTDLYTSTAQVSGSGGQPFGFDMVSSTIGWASATINGGGVVVLRTIDGTNWTDLSINLPGAINSSYNIIGFDANLAYLSTNDGVYETNDGGSNWIQKNILTGRMTKIADNR